MSSGMAKRTVMAVFVLIVGVGLTRSTYDTL